MTYAQEPRHERASNIELLGLSVAEMEKREKKTQMKRGRIVERCVPLVEYTPRGSQDI